MARNKSVITVPLTERLAVEANNFRDRQAAKAAAAESLALAANQAAVDSAIAEGHAAAVDKALDILTTAGVYI